MVSPGNRVGIRNKIPANRERMRPEYDYSEAAQEQLVSGLNQFIIGRFLVGKSLAKRNPDRIDNPLVDVQKSLTERNRKKGVALEVGKVLLTYQSASEFQERYLSRVLRDKEGRRYTPRGLNQHMSEVKRSIADTFRKRSEEEYLHQEDAIREELRMDRLEQMKELEKTKAFSKLSIPEWNEEYDSLITEAKPTPARGFIFTRNIHFEDELVGVKIKESDELSVALMQKDIDKINDAYDMHDLINDDFPEVTLEDVSKFIPLFSLTMNPNEAENRLSRPVITSLRVPFQDLGIHRIQ